jgi:3-phosphoshikimate 1-carboxyvinyltransferase
MAELTVHSVKNINAEFEFPGDKSISHRALILSSISEGNSKILNLSTGNDVQRTRDALRLMGIEINSGVEVIVKGRGMLGLKEPGDIIDAGNSGTTARLLCGLLSPQKFFSVITGDESLRRRPMKRVVDPLREIGAEIYGRENSSLLPLCIRGRNLKGKKISINVASAQVKSALLLAGLYTEGVTVIIEPAESRDHTERMLKFMGAEIKKDGNVASVRRCEKLEPLDIIVPGDISSAAFFIVAGTIVKGSEIIIKNVCLNPLRTGVIDVLKRMGADIEIVERREEFEPFGTVRVRYSTLKGTTIKGADIPRVIDEIPVIAVAASVAEGETIIQNAEELRKKESDRIRTLCTELKKMGVDIEELQDGMRIRGGRLKSARLESHKDHRIGMALAIAGLVADGETTINGTEWIDISFPEFRQYLRRILNAE